MSKIAFIFPGQGAQACGMGKDFYEQTETGKRIFDKATQLMGFSMPQLCFEENDRLDITEYTQAAMVTASIAMMRVLEENGIITLKEDAGLNATKKDVEENPHNIEIVELDAAQIARVVEELDFVILNGNYALDAGFNVQTDAIAKEEADSEAAQTYANIIAVKKENKDSEKIKALVEVLQSEEIGKFITDTYEGAVVPMK